VFAEAFNISFVRTYHLVLLRSKKFFDSELIREHVFVLIIIQHFLFCHLPKQLWLRWGRCIEKQVTGFFVVVAVVVAFGGREWLSFARFLYDAGVLGRWFVEALVHCVFT
jgi:hypothetical protein